MLYDKASVFRRFDYLNDLCLKASVILDITIIGGTAMLFNFDNSRMTIDIDAVIHNKVCNQDVDIDELLDQATIDRNGGNVMCVPDVFDCERYLLKSYSNLNIFVFSVEELAASKIFTIRQKDLDDLINIIFPQMTSIQLDTLKNLLSEYCSYYVGNIDNPDLNLNNPLVVAFVGTYH